MELVAEACEEAGIWEILATVGFCDEFVEFDFFSQIRYWGGP